jgi:hypothetical protein
MGSRGMCRICGWVVRKEKTWSARSHEQKLIVHKTKDQSVSISRKLEGLLSQKLESSVDV